MSDSREHPERDARGDASSGPPAARRVGGVEDTSVRNPLTAEARRCVAQWLEEGVAFLAEQVAAGPAPEELAELQVDRDEWERRMEQGLADVRHAAEQLHADPLPIGAAAQARNLLIHADRHDLLAAGAALDAALAAAMPDRLRAAMAAVTGTFARPASWRHGYVQSHLDEHQRRGAGHASPHEAGQRWCSCGAEIGHNAVLCVDCTFLLEEELAQHRAWAAREPERCSALVRVLEAAERRSGELLDQASVYERKGMQPIADETLSRHYRPLKHAIATLRGDIVIIRRDVAEQTAALIEAVGSTSEQPEICAAITRALRGDGDATPSKQAEE